MSTHKEVITTLILIWIEKNTNKWIPKSIIKVIVMHHGYYNTNFKSDILSTLKHKLTLMEIIYKQLNEYPTLKRIFSGKQDGFKTKKWHNICDKISPTITILKDDGDYIFGGYTTAEWTQKNENWGYKTDKKAFLFNIHPHNKIYIQKHGNNGCNAICCSDSSKYIIRFGNGDLMISGENSYIVINTTVSSKYIFNFGEMSKDDISFSIKNIETFKVT